MVVRRRGSSPEAKEIRTLGRVLVTIDDVRALHDEVARHCWVTGPPEMEFNGGTFDDPEDLRTLSDVELEHIAIKGGAVEVHLATESARAFGDHLACEDIYTRWARSRQTTRRSGPPTLSQLANAVIWVVVGLFMIALVVAVFLISPIESQSHPGQFEPVWKIAVVVTAFLVIGVGSFNFARQALLDKRESYAIIYAMSRDEYRKDRVTSLRHWQIATISLAGACVTLLIGLISTLVDK